MPDNHHPLTDTADCSTGQSDHVWFLGGTFTQAETAAQVLAGPQRSCIVPPGTFLFVPIINAEASTLEGNGDTEEELLAAASALQDLATNMSITIDGTSVPNVGSYRVQSPLFTYGPLPDHGLFGLPQGATSPAAGDGVYVMVKPLSVGTHTVYFHGEVPDFDFTVDMTYNITVAPGHG
jgi:hypothetical protein